MTQNRSLNELLSKSALALQNSHLIEIATTASSPKAASDMARDWPNDYRQSTRFLACIRRDHEDQFEGVVLDAVHEPIEGEDGLDWDDLTHLAQDEGHLVAVAAKAAGICLRNERSIAFDIESDRGRLVTLRVLEDNDVRESALYWLFLRTNNAERSDMAEWVMSEIKDETLLAEILISVFQRMLAESPTNGDRAFVVENCFPILKYYDFSMHRDLVWLNICTNMLLTGGPTMSELVKIVSSPYRFVGNYADRAWDEIRQRIAAGKGNISQSSLKRIIERDPEDNIARSARVMLKK